MARGDCAILTTWEKCWLEVARTDSHWNLSWSVTLKTLNGSFRLLWNIKDARVSEDPFARAGVSQFLLEFQATRASREWANLRHSNLPHSFPCSFEYSNVFNYGETTWSSRSQWAILKQNPSTFGWDMTQNVISPSKECGHEVNYILGPFQVSWTAPSWTWRTYVIIKVKMSHIEANSPLRIW